MFTLTSGNSFSSEWRNVFRVTTTTTNRGNVGDRVPAVFVSPDQELYIIDGSESIADAPVCKELYTLEPTTIYNLRMRMT